MAIGQETVSGYLKGLAINVRLGLPCLPLLHVTRASIFLTSHTPLSATSAVLDLLVLGTHLPLHGSSTDSSSLNLRYLTLIIFFVYVSGSQIKGELMPDITRELMIGLAGSMVFTVIIPPVRESSKPRRVASTKAVRNTGEDRLRTCRYLRKSHCLLSSPLFAIYASISSIKH